MWFEDSELRDTVIAAVVAIPYVVEILLQLPLLTRLMRALPDETRAGLPRHPRHPWLAVFGSARFFVALFRLALRDGATDGPELLLLKRRARASAVRELIFGIAFWTTVVILWRRGWRPLWPR
jgi:hypothetical protein